MTQIGGCNMTTFESCLIATSQILFLIDNICSCNFIILDTQTFVFMDEFKTRQSMSHTSSSCIIGTYLQVQTTPTSWIKWT